MAVDVAVAVAVSGGGAVAVAVAVAGLTKKFFNHIQKDFLINVWGFVLQSRYPCNRGTHLRVVKGISKQMSAQMSVLCSCPKNNEREPFTSAVPSNLKYYSTALIDFKII